jgi:DNA-binding response OmpR family regulator
MVDSSKTILIADDDDDTRSIVFDTISVLGYVVIQAKDGEQALRLFEASNPDVVVLDWMMPGRSGPEVCTEIKKRSAAGHVPVLLLTALDSVQNKVHALDGGADDYLTKPFHCEELQARVRALLRVRDLTVELARINVELRVMQERLLEKERELVIHQIAGTAAHQLGQPLSAILLNCHLLQKLQQTGGQPMEPKYARALVDLQRDARRMAELIEQLKQVDPKKREAYHGTTEILELSGEVPQAKLGTESQEVPSPTARPSR